jgi:dCTP diphosphatase
MSDADTTLAALRAEVHHFVEERDWAKFHNPKNLAMSIAIEAAELMEHFQWQGGEEGRDVRRSTEDFQAVREELADIFCFLLAFANALDIDLTSSLREKMVKNAVKYPADRFRGRFR